MADCAHFLVANKRSKGPREAIKMNQYPQDRPAGYPPPESYPPQGPPTAGYPQSGFPPPGFYGITPAPPEPPKKKHTLRTIVLSVLGTLLIVVVLLGFVGANTTPTPAPASSRPVPTQQAPTPQAAPVPVVPAPTQTVPENPQSSWGASQFDRYVVLESGLQVIASAPENFTPSATSAGNSGVRAFSTEITVRNGTSQPLNPSMISVNASVNGQQAESVFDSAQDIGLPTTTVLPGRSVTYRAAFSSPVDHGAVQVDVSPGFDNGTASFEGSTL